MNKKIIALTIVGLCFISVLVGIFGNVKTSEETEKLAAAKKHPGIFKKFPLGTDKIALVNLDGPIVKEEKESFFSGVNSAVNALKVLEKIEDDKSVKGLIFRINSPGGTVGMSQEIYNSILRIRETRPVIISMADVAASGGYYVACAADRIYANPGTITGSIGVIMGTINAQELLTQKLGVKSENIKSGKYKDLGSIYRPLKEDEKALLQGLVNNAYNQFLTSIVNGRMTRVDEYKVPKVELTEENLRQYSDGRVFTGEQAIKYGFVDKLGGLYQAKQDIITMAQQKYRFLPDDTPIINYNKSIGVSDFFLNISESFFKPGFEVKSLLPMSSRYPRQPLFIWE